MDSDPAFSPDPAFSFKHAFAENVVKTNIDKIDFSGFAPLLERIAAAIAALHGITPYRNAHFEEY